MAGLKILSRILERIGDTFELKRGVVSVEMGEGFITLAETVVSGGRQEVVRLVSRPIDPKAKDAPETIKALFRSLNISSRRVRLNIPRHLVSVRLLKLPSTDEKEIGKMVRIESLKHVPYAEEEAVSGHRVVERFDDGYSNVLAAVTQAGTIKSLTELLNKAGLAVEFVSLGSETLLLWYLCTRPLPEERTVLLVNIDIDHINIDVIAGDRLVFTRGVSYGSQSSSSEKIIKEINISTAAYRKEAGRPVDKILLTGAPKRIESLKAVLGDRLAAPVDVMDQTAGIPKSKAADLESEDGSFVEVLGLSLKSGEVRINLLPESVQEENRLESIKRNASISLAILVLITAAAVGATMKKLHDKRACLSYIDSQFKKMTPQLKDAKRMARQISIVKAKLAERPFAIDILNEVFRITPAGISLTLMEYEAGRTVTLRGDAPSLGDVFKYVAVLQGSPYFKNVKVKYANKRTTPTTTTADFEIISSVAAVKDSRSGQDAHKKSD